METKKTPYQSATGVRCPTCRSGPGDFCRRVNGGLLMYPHAARVKKARAENPPSEPKV